MTKIKSSFQIYSDRVIVKSRKFHSVHLFVSFCLMLSLGAIGFEIYLFATKEHIASQLYKYLLVESLLSLIFTVCLIELNKNNYTQLKFHNNCFTLKKDKKDISIIYDDIKRIKLGFLFFTIITKNRTIRISPYNLERAEYVIQEIQKILPNKFWIKKRYDQYIEKLILMDHGTKYGNLLNFASVISDPKFGAVQFILTLTPLVVFKLQHIEYSLKGDQWLASSLIMYLYLFLAVTFIVPWILLIIYKVVLTNPEGKMNRIYPAGKARIFALIRFSINSLFIIGFLVSTYIYGHNLQDSMTFKYLLPSKSVSTPIIVDYRYSCFKCLKSLRINDFAYIDYISDFSVVKIASLPDDESGYIQVISTDDYQEFKVHMSTVLGKVFFENLKRQKELFEYLK